MKKKAALKDIAREVGVSTALVSYVLNNQEEKKRVGKEMAVRIKQVAAELNYSPNQIARSLKTNKTNTIGIIVADIHYRYTSGVTKSIEAECQKYDYSVIYGSSGENPQKFARLIRLLADRQVDGLILVPVTDCAEEIEYLNKHEIPFVLIDRILPNTEANVIAIDNGLAAIRSTAHLVNTGHSRIGLITYRSGLLNLIERKSGYLAALAGAGLTADPMLIKEVGNTNLTEEVARSVDELLALSPACDSIFFATDTLAVEGLRHINALQIPIPERLGIVSFDESDAFELFYCPITHGRQPLEEIGRMAVDTLIDTMQHPKTRKKILLETEFLIGKSCGET
jgi:LacI family transcriptional regulator